MKLPPFSPAVVEDGTMNVRLLTIRPSPPFTIDNVNAMFSSVPSNPISFVLY